MALQTVVADILWNLDIIGAVSNHQTLLVDGDKLAFDTRYLQWLRRPVTGDSRSQILAAVDKTFQLFEEVLHSYQCNSYISNTTTHVHQEQLEIADNILNNLQNLMSRKTHVNNGLSTLSTFERYNDDSGFKIEMNRFSERMQKLCRKCETLKQKMIQRMPQRTCCYNIGQSDIQPLNSFNLDMTPSPSVKPGNETKAPHTVLAMLRSCDSSDSIPITAEDSAVDVSHRPSELPSPRFAKTPAKHKTALKDATHHH